MRYYKSGNILIPNISSSFNRNNVFKKKFPLKILIKPLHDRYLIDYRESPIKFFPFTKDHPTVYDGPYMNQPPYYGIQTDIRWYDLYAPGPSRGTKQTELY